MQERVGPYEVEKRLAIGGMAEVFVARRTGPHGFSKRIALKRILPQFAKDADFVAMFIEEARLAAHLDHPNIVHVFDFGDYEDNLFLAMELVDGTNVNRLLRAVYLRGETVALDASLHIAAQTARALAYAHQACDEAGTPLHIVHRDVSPANILLTRSGHVKLSDFGIAYVAMADRRTEDGRVRGKLGYMSPEQVRGEPLNGRSDVFTLTTVLAEMLLAEPLFGTGSELDVLLRIRNVDLGVLERSARPIPADVRKLLEVGLVKEPYARPTALEFAEALDAVIARRKGRERGPQALAKLLMRLELVSQRPYETDATESGARPTWLLQLERSADERTRSDAPVIEGSEATQGLRSYWIQTPSGKSAGPVDFPELVRMLITGIIPYDSKISMDGLRFEAVRAYPELVRFLRSQALQWDDDETTQATWTGDLSGARLLPLIYRITATQETGVVYLADQQRRKKMYFVNGQPEFIASTDSKELLGEFLVDTGVCKRGQVDHALLRLDKYDGHLGDALVGTGALRPVELFRAVYSQVRTRYLEAFRWTGGRWYFVRDARSNEESFPIRQDPYELMRDASLQPTLSQVEETLRPVFHQKLSLVATPPISRRSFHLPPVWENLLDTIHGDVTLAQWLHERTQLRQSNPEDIYRAVYFGLSCELVQAA